MQIDGFLNEEGTCSFSVFLPGRLSSLVSYTSSPLPPLPWSRLVHKISRISNFIGSSIVRSSILLGIGPLLLLCASYSLNHLWVLMRASYCLVFCWSFVFLYLGFCFVCLYLGEVEGAPKPGMSSATARNMAILQHIPFVVPFKDRVKVRWTFCYAPTANRSSPGLSSQISTLNPK